MGSTHFPGSIPGFPIKGKYPFKNLLVGRFGENPVNPFHHHYHNDHKNMKTIKELEDWINSHEYKNWKSMIMDKELKIQTLKDVVKLIDEMTFLHDGWINAEELKSKIEGK